MMSPPRTRGLFLSVLLLGSFAGAQGAAETLHYAGTVGQQRVSLLLEVSGESIRGGHYHYDGQKSEINFVDTRQFGTTIVLQDEDGSILHLHFEDAAGEKTGSFQKAAMLEGTLDRGELDLPIRLKRAEDAASKP